MKCTRCEEDNELLSLEGFCIQCVKDMSPVIVFEAKFFEIKGNPHAAMVRNPLTGEREFVKLEPEVHLGFKDLVDTQFGDMEQILGPEAKRVKVTVEAIND